MAHRNVNPLKVMFWHAQEFYEASVFNHLSSYFSQACTTTLLLLVKWLCMYWWIWKQLAANSKTATWAWRKCSFFNPWKCNKVDTCDFYSSLLNCSCENIFGSSVTAHAVYNLIRIKTNMDRDFAILSFESETSSTRVFEWVGSI